ncbi:MAG: radical SAM protein, partial [Planctomycetota bacterium]|nr:radical SAM protein [Planctomycetota bacterium]
MLIREDIDQQLLARYDQRGPRYTSYPPANHFQALTQEELSGRWQRERAASADKGLGLYVHLPFCRSRCLYCACHVEIGAKQPLVTNYLQALHRELELVAEHVDAERPVNQVVLGGGTPNFLTPEQLRRLFARIDELWSPQATGERSVELDPRVATAAGLDAFLDAGFNRFSLGVQDLDESVVRRVRPGGNQMAVEDVYAHLRGAGIESVNFDLIYGLPGQTVATAARTAQRVIDLAPTRLALYSYAHVPWIKPHQAALEKRG